MQPRAAHIQTLGAAAAKDTKHRQVDHQTAGGNRQHPAAEHLRRLGETANGFDEDVNGDCAEGRSID